MIQSSPELYLDELATWLFQITGKLISRVTTDLENLENLEKSGNLKETSETQGICLKSGEFFTEFQKSGKSQGILLSEIHFQPS